MHRLGLGRFYQDKSCQILRSEHGGTTGRSIMNHCYGDPYGKIIMREL